MSEIHKTSMEDGKGNKKHVDLTFDTVYEMVSFEVHKLTPVSPTYYFTSTSSQTNILLAASFEMFLFSFQMPFKFLEDGKPQQTFLL